MNSVAEMYWNSRSRMIDAELLHMQDMGTLTNDPWLDRVRAVRMIDTDFARVMNDLRQAEATVRAQCMADR